MGASAIGNVTGALLLGWPATRSAAGSAQTSTRDADLSEQIAHLLAELFSETLLVGGRPTRGTPGRRVSNPAGEPSVLGLVVAALEAATCPRVLIVAADPPPHSADALLALCCWPGRDAVLPADQDEDHPICAIYEREVCLAAAREALDSGRSGLRELLDRIDCDRVTAAQLALSVPDVAPLNFETWTDPATRKVGERHA